MNERAIINRRSMLKTAALTAAIPIAGSGGALGAVEHEARQPTGKLRKAYFDGPDGQIHYWTAGEGPNLFLIHQSNKSNEEYAGLVPYLSGSYRLIAMDLPGHGHSDDPSEPFTVDSLTDAAIALADHLGIATFHIFGHHGGSLVAMNLAARVPERTLSTILSGKSGPKPPEESQQYRTEILSRDIPLDWEGESLARTWKRYASLRSDGSRVEDLVLPYLMTVRTGIRPYDVYNTFLTWNMGDIIDRLTGPVLLVQCEKDVYVDRQAELLPLLADGYRVTVPGCGAYWAYERPEICARVIQDFLEQVT